MSISSRIRAALVVLVVATATGATGCAYGRTGFGFTYIQREPPAARVEVIGTAPGPDYVWINGYWNWTGSDFAWVGGRWDRPVDGHREWVAHHWEHDTHGWHLVAGHWR